MIVYSKETIDLNLSKEEIAIIFVDGNILVSNKKNTLFLLNNPDEDIYKFGNIDIVNVNNIEKIIDYKNEYILRKSLIIDDVLYEFNGSIVKIKYNEHTFCIYNKKISDVTNIYGCNFLYLFNTTNVDNIDVDENVDIIFFNKNVEIPEYFIEDLYSKWIDIYKLNIDEYVVLKINKDDYKIIVIGE